MVICNFLAACVVAHNFILVEADLGNTIPIKFLSRILLDLSHAKELTAEAERGDSVADDLRCDLFLIKETLRESGHHLVSQ